MRHIFVNLKRFDVPRSLGGICPNEDVSAWTRSVIDAAVEAKLGRMEDVEVTFFFPESMVPVALAQHARYNADAVRSLTIGCQSVFRKDVQPGGNFGAFTTNLPAAAAKAMGCRWALIAHSEERADKHEILCAYDPQILEDPIKANQAYAAEDGIFAQEVTRALERGMDVVFCVGETAAERGDGTFEEQKPRIIDVLKRQLGALKGTEALLEGRQLWIGYEPVWAIGPGKTPPDAPYIAFVSDAIKKILREEIGMDIPVVYGGGLKKENAAAISAVDTVDGGLVALTKFTQPVAFEPAGLKEIIDEYMEGYEK